MINAPLKGFDPAKFSPLLNEPCLLELSSGKTVIGILECKNRITAIWRLNESNPKLISTVRFVIQDSTIKQWAYLPGWRSWDNELSGG